MVSGPEVDFSSFLEFGDLQLTFPPYDANNHAGQETQGESNGAHQMEMQTSNDTAGAVDFQDCNMPPFADPPLLTGFDSSSAVFSDLVMDPQLFEQQQQQLPNHIPQTLPYGQPYRGHNLIPHTPNSIEMHGGQPQYQHMASNHQAHTMYDHYRQQSKGQVPFPSHTCKVGINGVSRLPSPLWYLPR